MTCIVGIADKGAVYIGGDSAGVGGYQLTVRADSKVFVNEGFVFGFTTSFRMGQLMRYAFVPPSRHPDTDLMKYMVTDFVDALRETLKKGGFAETHHDAEQGGTFLVGHAGRLFRVDDDYQVGESVHGYDACGCGAEVAIGALHVTKKLNPMSRAKSALAAAEANSAGVRGPFKVLRA